MAELKLEKAQLWELEDDFTKEKDKTQGKRVTVQFNPESLKVGFSNQIEQTKQAGDEKGSPAIQFVGAGPTKLSLQLWFDVTQPIAESSKPEADKNTTLSDVRKLTEQVTYFITPKLDAKKKFKPPAVRFLWGSFQFDGLVESLDESLEFFSAEGKPLRASITLNLTAHKVTSVFTQDAKQSPTGAPAPGIQQLTQAPAGATVQGLADSQGRGNDWQAIAAANGIENPRMLQPGQLLDMNALKRA